MSLVPTPIVDKNGVATTRHKKVEEASVSRLGAMSAPSVSVHEAVVDEWSVERQQAVNLLEEIGDEIVVSNHGAFPNKRPTVSLGDMNDGDVARGNCWSIVNEIIEVAGTDYFGDYVDELNINTKGGLSHTGLFVKSGEREYVVDYTIRQFNQDLDFPLIATVNEWKSTVEKAYGGSFEFTPYQDDDNDEDSYDEYDDD